MGIRKGEEGLASGLINTSRQIGGPTGLAVLLTVANLAIPYQTSHLLNLAAAAAAAVAAMVTGFGYAFLAAATLTGIGIAFSISLKQEKHPQGKAEAPVNNLTVD